MKHKSISIKYSKFILITSIVILGGIVTVFSARLAVLFSLLINPLADGIISGLFFVWLISLALFVNKPGIVLFCSIIMGSIEGVIGKAIFFNTIGFSLLAGISIETAMILLNRFFEGKKKLIITAMIAGLMASISRCLILQILAGPFPPAWLIRYWLTCIIGGTVIGGGFGWLIYIVFRKINFFLLKEKTV